MDSTKSAIKSFVLDLRKTLEAEIELRLRRYGIAAGKWRDVGELKHLNDREIAERIRLEEALHHELHHIGGETNDVTRAEAVHWFVREVAFTHLNRLAALKVLEVRRLIEEIIQPRSEYGQRSYLHRQYRDAHPAEANGPDDALEAAIKTVCRRIYPEFRILFDVGDPSEGHEPPANSLIWPSYPVLTACLAKLNALDAAAGRSGPPAFERATPEHSVWAEDEIIGWIYQFYNAEEKVAIRDRGKPQHPAEVAVINQYFTPRWIVKFLVDNTLGRLWLEMHPDSPRVRAKCDYLVPEPFPFSSTGDGPGVRVDSSSPINNPAAPARRATKRPQDLRLIDPACGTMHFGHYAFEVFQAIYADAREQGWVTGADALSDEDVPAAILRHNLYGVDIDLRAVQLAALSLFIKAKTANPDARIDRVNLVVADAYLPEGAVREEFLKQYADDLVIQQAFREVFDSLNNVAEVGSLLRVEARFRQILEAAEHPAVNGRSKRAKAAQQGSFADLTPGWTPEYTVEQMLNHLREFARKALQEHDLNAQLFATETEKSVALLDVFLHEYDVAVMNPPYGETTVAARKQLSFVYPITGFDLYAAFMERGLQMLAFGGYLGSLTSRTFLTLTGFEEFRKFLLFETSPIAFVDLGFGILDDALVETNLSVIGKTKAPNSHIVQFWRRQENQLNEPALDGARNIALATLRQMPGYQFAYRAPSVLLDRYTVASKRLGDVTWAKMGIATGKDAVFLRNFWEIDRQRSSRDWRRFSKGGDFSRYYADVHLLIDWTGDGEPLKKYPGSRLRGRDYYGKGGITWPWITVKGFNARLLEPDLLFANISPLLPLENDPDTQCALLALLNSSTASAFLDLITPSRNYTAGQVNALPLPERDFHSLKVWGKRAFELKADWDAGNEVCTHFTLPWLLQIANRKLRSIANVTLESPCTLSRLTEFAIEVETELTIELRTIQSQIDEAVFGLYDISEPDRLAVERELAGRPIELVWPYAERLTREQKAAEHVARLMSYYLLQAIKADEDGILPITDGTGQPAALAAVRAGLEKQFGEAAADQMEIDAANYLGRSLGDWLAKNFWKDYHLKWYKNRPILWQLQSTKGQFACLIYIHKLNRDTLSRVRTQYLWPVRNAAHSELDDARHAEEGGDRGAAKRVAKAETLLEELAAFEQTLIDVIEARVKCDIPEWAEGPYRHGQYDPVLDDGVAVNILPLQTAGLLTKAKVV